MYTIIYILRIIIVGLLFIQIDHTNQLPVLSMSKSLHSYDLAPGDDLEQEQPTTLRKA